jgi:hypothetical protein
MRMLADAAALGRWLELARCGVIEHQERTQLLTAQAVVAED